MTYATERDTVGRRPANIFEIDLDKCANTYGSAPCTAALAAGSECYNTRKTCQDPANYANTSTLTLKFSDQLIDGQDYIPCIESITAAPVEISPGQAFSKRASITIRLRDFPHHDRGIDPYVSTRAYTPENQGTFFGKLMARNPFYQGRPARLRSGYIASTFSTGDFQTQNFVIEKISGPDKNGIVTIVAKDVLKLADDDRALCPIPSTGKLEAAISAAATSLTVTSGTQSEYTDEYVRIGDEIILAPTANRSANVFSNLTRGTWGTTAATHAISDSVQNCKHFNNANVIDVINTLLTTFAGISSSYITIADWQAERDLWLTGSNLTRLISEPTGVKTLLDEIAEQIMVYIWWDSVNQKIRLKAVAPPSDPVVTWDDDANFLSDPVVDIKQDDLKTRVIVFYNPRNAINVSKPSDFDSVYAWIDADSESADKNDQVRLKQVLAPWITSDAQALTTASRLKRQFNRPPTIITFPVDAKDSGTVTGDFIKIDSRSIQGADGANDITLAQVLSVEEMTKDIPASEYKYKVLLAQFADRYGRIMSASASSTYGSATDDEKEVGCYIIAAGATVFSDGGEGYRIA